MTDRVTLKNPGRKLRLIAAVLAAIAAPFAFCQSSGTASQAQDSAIQSPAFEVSTVRINKSGSSRSDSTYNSGRLTATNVSLKNVLQYDAYGIPGSQILAGPNWLNSARFDIEAKADAATVEKLRALTGDRRHLLEQQMVQQLLADRFKLALHSETRELPVYALVVAKSGSKLSDSKAPCGESGTHSGNGVITAKCVSMANLTRTLTTVLAKELGRVVIDKTGIEGNYDMTLNWTPEDGSTSGVNTANGGSATQDSSGPSIFTAIQEQLGLKLESTKGPVEVLVIDHAEMPSEN